jgi:enoyl-CoA hydratase
LAGQVLLGAETEDRERARALGIVDELTEPGELLPRAVALATELAARCRSRVRGARHVVPGCC